MFDHFTRRRIFFDEGGAGGGTPDPDDKKKKKKDDDPEGDDGGDKAAKQKELDKQFADRAKRAAETERKAIWDALGIKSQDDWDAYLKNKQEAEDKQKSETQKLADKAAKAEADLAKLKSDKEQEISEMRKRVQDTEIKVLASQPETDKDGKLKRPSFRKDELETVLLLVKRDEIKEEDGKYVGIEKALADLAKEHPALLADDKTPETSKGNPKGPGNKKSKPVNQGDDEEPWFKSL